MESYIPEEGKLRVLWILVYATIFIVTMVAFGAIQNSCVAGGQSNWSCIKQYKIIYLLFYFIMASSVLFIANPVGQIIRNYKIKDEYANHMKINLHLQNIKLLKSMGYYKNNKTYMMAVQVATEKKQPRKPRR